MHDNLAAAKVAAQRILDQQSKTVLGVSPDAIRVATVLLDCLDRLDRYRNALMEIVACDEAAATYDDLEPCIDIARAALGASDAS